MDVSLFFPIAGLITLFSAYLVWNNVLHGGGQNRHPRYESLLMTLQSLATFFTLTGIVLLQPISSNEIHFTLVTAAATATLFVQAMYLFGLLRHGIQGIGLFLLPVIAVLLLVIPTLPEDSTGIIHTSSILHSSHLLISMFAYAVLTMTTFYAVMHLLLDQALKRKRIHPVIQAMPPLMKLENLMLSLLQWSVWLIALSILTGLTWQWVDFANFALFSHKVLLALFSFSVLFWLLNHQKKAAWHGRRTSQLIIAAYALMLLAYFGVHLIQAWLS